MSRLLVARMLSIVAHPAVLVPAAATWSAIHGGAALEVVRVAAGATVAIAIAVVGYSVVKVRTGDWAHVDASHPRERVQLNRFLILALVGAALWTRGSAAPPALSVGLLVCAALVALAWLLRHWLTLSLHVGFAVLAALLCWPTQPATTLLLVVAAGLAWSRLALNRHTPADVLAGSAAGALAGIVFQLAS